VTHEGKLGLDSFQVWLSKTPEVATFLDDIFPYFEEIDTESEVTTSPVEEGGPREKRTSSWGIPPSKTTLKQSGSTKAVFGGSLLRSPSSIGQQSPVSPHSGKSSFFERSPSQHQFPTSPGANAKHHFLKCEGCKVELSFCVHCGAEYSKHNTAHLTDGIIPWVIECNKCSKQGLFSYCGSCGQVFARDSWHTTVEAIQISHVHMTGWLYKVGRMFKSSKKRWHVLQETMLYTFNDPEDHTPKHVLFLNGCYVDMINDADKESQRMFGFTIVSQNKSKEDSKTLYAHSPEERDNWVAALRKASHVIPIEEQYIVGKKLGEGRFSVVKSCISKRTGVERAVKVIEKVAMDPEEKELMRTEIAILKLVHHDNVIQMIDVFEDRDYIYIVMEMVKGGELFDRIVGRSVMDEWEACSVIIPLANCLAYLHKLGIIHRDLKPENILCGEKLSEVKIADFGLSKLVVPSESCTLPCGTLSYVAPEVISNKGYTKSADIWSLGVILHLLLKGKLPFKGANRDELIRKIQDGSINLDDSKEAWKISEEAKDLLSKMLSKDVHKRLTAEQVLEHPWVLKHRAAATASSTNVVATTIAPIRESSETPPPATK
jgi:serine/threonine protein kinase